MLSRRDRGSRPQQLLGDARHPQAGDDRSARHRRCLAARSARLLQPRPQRRLRRVLHRARPVLPGSEPADAAHLRAHAGAHQPGGRLDRGRLPTGRGAAVRAERRGSTHRCARGRADPQRGHDPGGHRRHPQRDPGVAHRSPRPRHPHRTDLRRRDGPRRAGRGQRRRQGAQPDEDGRHVRTRHSPVVRLPPREHGLRAVARSLRQRSASDRPGDEVRLDQRHDRGGSARPVRVGDGRRQLLVVERRAGRLRPRCDVLARRSGLRRASLGDAARFFRRFDLQDRAAARRRRCGDDAEEHSRQGGDRMGCGRAARPLDPRARCSPHRHRTPGPPRCPHHFGPIARLPLGSDDG